MKGTCEEQELDKRLTNLNKVALNSILHASMKGLSLKKWYTENQERAEMLEEEDRRDEASKLIRVIIPQFKTDWKSKVQKQEM